MEHRPSKHDLDDWLDKALAEYGRAEPRPGIESRALAGLCSRLQRRSCRTRWLRPVWLSAVAVTILVFVIVIFHRPERPPAPELMQRNDHELLLGIDRLLDKEVPSALEPALVLTKEIVKKKQ
jgi:hypothetical protein